MKRNSFKYRVLMLFLSNALLQLMGFAYRAALSRTAAASALGLNSLVMQLYGVAVSLCISGLNVAVQRVCAASPEKSPAVLKSALAVFAALWLLAALPAFSLGRGFSAAALGSPGAYKTVRLMLVCIFMTGVENMLKSVHMGVKRVSRCAVSELCEQAVRFVLVILFLKKTGPCSDERAAFLIMLGMVFSEFVSVSFLLSSYFLSVRRPGPIPRVPVMELVRVAFPVTLTALSANLFSSAGTLLLPGRLAAFGLSREASLAAIGELNNVCIPISMLPVSLVGAVSAVLMPEAASLFASGRSPRRIIGRSIKVSAAASVFALAVLYPASRPIASSVFGASVELLPQALLLLRAALIFPDLVCVSAMNALGMQDRVLVNAVVSEAASLAAMLFAASRFGVAGYASSLAIGAALRLALDSPALFVKMNMVFPPEM